MENKLLPIGSVVLTIGSKKKIFVAGFTGTDGNKMYDYIGFTYPEGFLSRDKILLFNHDKIEKVFYKGYESPEENKFKEELYEFIKNQKNGVENNGNK